jgi:hypothetical protein
MSPSPRPAIHKHRFGKARIVGFSNGYPIWQRVCKVCDVAECFMKSQRRRERGA